MSLPTAIVEVANRTTDPFSRIVPRTEGNTYAANVWAVSIVQRPFLLPRARPFSSSGGIPHLVGGTPREAALLGETGQGLLDEHIELALRATLTVYKV